MQDHSSRTMRITIRYPYKLFKFVRHHILQFEKIPLHNIVSFFFSSSLSLKFEGEKLHKKIQEPVYFFSHT